MRRIALSGVTLLLFLGSLAGFLSGLLGIGGGILMVPLLLYVPPLLGQPWLDMKAVAGITMVQSLAASLVGTLAHGRHRTHTELVVFMGGAIAAGALIGGVTSYWLNGTALKILFAILALLAGVLLMFPVRHSGEEAQKLPSFNRLAAASLAFGIGLLGGLVGQGGGFMIVPALVYVLRIPTRVALGSSLAIGLISGAAGFAGKVMTAQIPLWQSMAVVIGTIAGSLAGSRLSQRLHQVTLRRTLAAVVIITALRMSWDLLPWNEMTKATVPHSAPASGSSLVPARYTG